MKLGWLWLSILKTTARPSPMSITPAFSPGPWMTQGALVGSPRRWMREDLYEQCSFHIAEKIPSSVKLGSRPISFRMRSYSSGFSPWAATSSGVIFGSLRSTGWPDGVGKTLTARQFTPPQASDFRSSHGVSGWLFEPFSPYGGTVTMDLNHRSSL